MSDPKYVSEGGVSREVTPEQENELFSGGGVSDIYGAQEVSKERALQENQLEEDRKLAASMPGYAKASVGLLQGASLGLAAPALIKAEQMAGIDPSLDRRYLSGLQQGGGGGLYGAANLGGLAAGSILTGGLLDEAGVASGLGRMLPEATGITGTAVQGAAKLGFHGGIEGAAAGLGNAMEESVLQNKDLAAEAVLSHMSEGALIGAGFGAAFGGIGGALKGVAGKAAGIAGDSTENYLAKRAGLTGSVTKEIGQMEDGMRGFMSRSSELLESEGAKISSSPEELVSAARKVESRLGKQLDEIASELDKSGVPKPSWDRFRGSIQNDVIGEVAMTPGGIARARALNAMLNEMVPVDVPSMDLGVSDFKGWIKGRPDMLAKARSLPDDLGPKVMAAYDAELRTAMQAAEGSSESLAGVTGRYQSAQLSRRTMQVLEAAAETRLSAGPEYGLSPHDLGTAGAIALSGHIPSAVSYVAGKAIGKGLANTYGPALAEMVWKASTASKVSQAVSSLKRNVSKAVDGLFSTGNRKLVTSYPTRDQFNKELQSYYAFAQKTKDERLRNYLAASKSLGLAQGMDSVAERALSNTMGAAPQDQGVAGMTKLRKPVHPKGLTIQEHLFFKKLQVIKSPLSVLDAAANGKVSKDQIQTLKDVWPETYSLVVSEAQNRIAQMKAEGKSLPLDKITQLSIVLDSPLDPVMTKEFISPVQQAMALPQPTPPPKPAQMPSNAQDAEGYETPGEKIT